MTELLTLLGFIFAIAIVVVLTIAGISYYALKERDDE
jgi:CHASE3 domain sensor protein